MDQTACRLVARVTEPRFPSIRLRPLLRTRLRRTSVASCRLEQLLSAIRCQLSGPTTSCSDGRAPVSASLLLAAVRGRFLVLLVVPATVSPS